MRNLKKVIFTIILLVLSNTCASANGTRDGSWDSYHELDRFQWTNYDNDVHLLSAYSLSLTGGLILTKWTGLKAWQAALIMTVAIGLVGTSKEVLHDAYTSRTDIKTWWAGAAAGGLTLTVLNF